MRKTTKIRFCRLPNGANNKTLRRPNGEPVWEDTISDIFIDDIYNPYLLLIMDSLGMVKKVQAMDNENKLHDVYIVRRMIMDIDAMELIQMIKSYGIIRSSDITQTICHIMGIRYILSTKKQFEVDVVVIEGNTKEDLKKSIESRRNYG